MKPKVLILRSAGTNCDRETEFAFRLAGAKTFRLHINVVKERFKDLDEFQIICIPGGFSYGDDLGAGKIFSLELLLWLKESLRKFLDKGGIILGICNGFQVLVKMGILPDLDFRQKVTLTFNDSLRFEARWVYLKVSDSENKDFWFKDLPQVFMLPVAHSEGKFFASQEVLERIEKNNLVALRYTDEKGNVAGYPHNPNGSLNNIAGIWNKDGNVLGLMPHPERFIFKHHYPFWKDKDIPPFGLKIFKNLVNQLK